VRITAVRASYAARRHIREKHGVEMWEVDEVLLGNHDVRRVAGARYRYEGCTEDGRLLRVIFEVRSGHRQVEAHIVTAYEPRR